MNATQSPAAETAAQLAEKTLAKFHAMPYARHFKAFKKLSAELQQAITEPCTGEVHSTGADGCMVCLSYTWGRMLKRTKEQLSRFPR